MLSFLRAALAAAAFAFLGLLASAIILISRSNTVTLHLYLPARVFPLQTTEQYSNDMYETMACMVVEGVAYLAGLTSALGALSRSSCRGGIGTVPLKEAVLQKTHITIVNTYSRVEFNVCE